jgi:hypothetical protein
MNHAPSIRESKISHSFAFAACKLRCMKTFLLCIVLLVLAACAPVNQTVTNVSNFVGGTQVVSYETDGVTLAMTIQNFTATMPMPSGYTPLRAEQQGIDKVIVSAQALKGSLDTNFDAEDFSLEFSILDKNGSTELTVRPSSASNDRARQIVTDYVKLLDEKFARAE